MKILFMKPIIQSFNLIDVPTGNKGVFFCVHQ